MKRGIKRKSGAVRLVSWNESGAAFMIKQMRELIREPKRCERMAICLPDERLVIHSASTAYEAAGFLEASKVGVINGNTKE